MDRRFIGFIGNPSQSASKKIYLLQVHPCVQHVLPMVVRQYITLCPYIVDSFLEYLRNMRGDTIAFLP